MRGRREASFARTKNPIMPSSLKTLIYMIKFMGGLVRHPLNRGYPVKTLGRYLGWHIGSRMLGHPVLYPFANDLHLHVGTGFWGATGIVHFGLEEYGDMSFCAHLLRPGDLFVDVGTCFGTYTLLASGVAGARAISFEPNPTTAEWLRGNLRLNRLEDLVEVRMAAVGDQQGCVFLTDHLRAANYIVAQDDPAASLKVQVPLTTLDHELRTADPTMIKIDVEGFEQKVLIGAVEVLKKESLVAVVVEDVGLRGRYHASSDIHQHLLGVGFASYKYQPERRELIDLQGQPNLADGNTLYVRRFEHVQQRLRDAQPFMIRDRLI